MYPYHVFVEREKATLALDVYCVLCICICSRRLGGKCAAMVAEIVHCALCIGIVQLRLWLVSEIAYRVLCMRNAY